MRNLAESWKNRQLVQRTVALIPWRSNLAIAGYTKPIGVAEWERQITESLPENLKSSLPTIEKIEGNSSPGGKTKDLFPVNYYLKGHFPAHQRCG